MSHEKKILDKLIRQTKKECDKLKDNLERQYNKLSKDAKKINHSVASTRSAVGNRSTGLSHVHTPLQ